MPVSIDLTIAAILAINTGRRDNLHSVFHTVFGGPEVTLDGRNSILHGSDKKPAFYAEGGERSEGLCPEDLEAAEAESKVFRDHVSYFLPMI